MLLLTDIVAAFVFSAKKTNKQTNKTKQNKKKKPNGTGALKEDSGLPGQRPHPKYCQIISTLSFMLMLDMGLFVFPHFKLWKL